MVTECEFMAVYNDHYQKIIQFLSRMVGPDDAEDLAQEVFDKISRSLAGFKGKSKVSTWVYRIAANTAIDRLRSSSHKQRTQSTAIEEEIAYTREERCGHSVAPAADQSVIRREMNECINEFVDALPLNYKTVLILKDFKEFSIREIANILEISPENAKVRLHRARAKLKEALNNGCDFYHNEQNILLCDRKPAFILPFHHR